LQNSPQRLVQKSPRPSQPRILLAIAKHRQLQRINLFQKIFRDHLTKKKAVIYSRTRDTWNLYKDKLKGKASVLRCRRSMKGSALSWTGPVARSDQRPAAETAARLRTNVRFGDIKGGISAPNFGTAVLN
jgi:hypothetical protein